MCVSRRSQRPDRYVTNQHKHLVALIWQPRDTAWPGQTRMFEGPFPERIDGNFYFSLFPAITGHVQRACARGSVGG